MKREYNTGKTERINIRIDGTIREQIADLMQSRELSTSEFIRVAIKVYIDTQKAAATK